MCIVADRPQQPLDAVLSACQQTFAFVTWSPGADNNAPITGFIVYYVTSHDSAAVGSNGPHVGARVGATDVSARVKLAPWTEYRFSVAAVNDVGISQRAEAAAEKPCKTESGPPTRSPKRVCTNSQRPDQLVIVWEVCHCHCRCPVMMMELSGCLVRPLHVLYYGILALLPAISISLALGLVSVLFCTLCYLYSLVKMYCGALFYLV